MERADADEQHGHACGAIVDVAGCRDQKIGAVDDPPDVARLDTDFDAIDAERRRLVVLYQAGLIGLPELQRRAADVEHRRRDLAERRDALTAQRQHAHPA